MMERRGVYYFDSKPVLVKGWNPEMDMHTEEIKSLPLWLQFPNLDVKHRGAESLSKTGSLLGILLKTNRYTKERSVLRYARLLIDIPLDSSFPYYIEFFNDNEMLLGQHATYKWKPMKCSHYHMFGHEEPVCKKKDEVRKEWRRVQRDNSQEEVLVESEAQQRKENTTVEFTPIVKRAMAR